MSVLINGMEMPTSCHECVAGYGGCCYVAPAEADGICPDHGRAFFCPIVPVPEHGDLIDRDALKRRAKNGTDEYGRPCMLIKLGYVNTMPTIIPANKNEGE